jgi:predicted lipid-binding transport protein (Tim44 family)
MKGLMIGGLAGMLFGGMLGSGFMSNMLGLLINVLAIYVLIVAIRGIFLYFRNRRKPAHPDDRSRY